MKVLVITSCTGEKKVEHKRVLTLKDFQKDKEHIKKREKQLEKVLTPARDLYSGQQHVRLMRGIHSAADKSTKNPIKVDLKIISAGYGLIPGSRKIAPYEATFNDMGKAELRDWANQLNIPKSFRNVVSKPYDLILVLLGDKYLETCAIDELVKFGGPTLILCSGTQVKKLPEIKKVKKIALINKEAKRFSCGLIGLKGELAARVLEHLSKVKTFKTKLFASSSDVLSLLDSEKKITKELKLPTKKSKPKEKPKAKRPPARANPSVDHVIELPKSWKAKPHKNKLRYFIPEWDDLVDPDYDFINDIHSGGTGDWSNEVYAHQMYPEPNYDGILISRAVAEKSKKKNARINEMGAHRYLRVPRDFTIMGDCGAFDYIDKDEPPYTTDDVIEYYTRLGFDLGVSVDHLIVPAFYDVKQYRYDLTIHNAEDFLKEHRKMGLPWEPIGAVQGWDPKSYADAVKKYQEMGYKTVALGGLTRSTTKDIASFLGEIKTILKPETNVHLFGIARPEALGMFSRLGVTSVDSASHLRRAWLVARNNYFTLDGDSFSAIRIPDVNKSFRAKRIVSEGKASFEKLEKIEKACLRAVHDFDNGILGLEKTLDILEEYDRLIADGRKGMREEYRRTLEEKPWKQCPCDICKDAGIEVMIFRGNNRNRRRGFHNTYVFYRLMQKTLLNDDYSETYPDQFSLFEKARGE